MIKEVSVIVREISFYSVLPGLLLGFLHLKRKRLPQTYRPIFFLLLLSITCDILARWAAREYQNNMPVSQFYSFGQAFLLFLFFSLAIPHARKPLLILGLVYISYYILNSIFIEPILTFNSNARIVQTLIFIPLCLYFFYSVYVHETIFQIEKSGVFWIVIGILIYYSGSFFTFLLSHKILQVPDNTFFGTWIVHNISNLLRNSCFFIGFLMSRHHE